MFNRPKGSKRCNIVHSLRTGKLPSLIDKSSCLSSMNVHCFIAMLDNQRVIQLGMVDRWVHLIPKKWCLQSGESSSCDHGKLEIMMISILSSSKKTPFFYPIFISLVYLATHANISSPWLVADLRQTLVSHDFSNNKPYSIYWDLIGI